MSSKDRFESKITIVRYELGAKWVPEDDKYPFNKRAYLVEDVPLPGQEVIVPSGNRRKVRGLGVGLYVDTMYEDDGASAFYLLHELNPRDNKKETLRKKLRKAFSINLWDNELDNLVMMVADYLEE